MRTLVDNFTEQELADLVREMEILKQFEPHPHVIQLYGACTQNGESLQPHHHFLLHAPQPLFLSPSCQCDLFLSRYRQFVFQTFSNSLYFFPSYSPRHVLLFDV